MPVFYLPFFIDMSRDYIAERAMNKPLPTANQGQEEVSSSEELVQSPSDTVET